jgi:hypothetical protein
MSGEIIQDESSNVTGIPVNFDNSLSSWVDLKNSFCEVDEGLDLLTFIWDQKEDCFHCPFLHGIGRDVPERCTKTFEYLESTRPIMEHRRSVHGYKTTVRGSRGIKIVLRDMPRMAPHTQGGHALIKLPHHNGLKKISI